MLTVSYNNDCVLFTIAASCCPEEKTFLL